MYVHALAAEQLTGPAVDLGHSTYLLIFYHNLLQAVCRICLDWHDCRRICFSVIYPSDLRSCSQLSLNLPDLLQLMPKPVRCGRSALL
jgi:hypothetical protein